MLQKRNYDVIIVGAGIIGVSVAHALSQRGRRCLVIDQGLVGRGCSFGNAGWITPCFAMPLPLPGMFLKSLRWLMDAESPLYIQPSASLDLAQWLWLFLKNMNQPQADRATKGLVQLSVLSQKIYRELAATNPAMAYSEKGLLMVSRTPEGLAAAHQEMNAVAALGISGRALTNDQIHELEPALQTHFRGGVYFPDEAMAEPYQVVSVLSDLSKKSGVDFLEMTECLEFTKINGQIVSVMTTAGQFSADQFVLATGSWSPRFAAQLDLRIPLRGGKGYSIIVPPLENQPKIPMMYLEKKIAITPRDGSLRIAGTLELVDQDFSINQRRVDAIIRGTREILPLPEQLEIRELWRGLRPCTPDGVPLIGRHQKWGNLCFALGHQMLGLQTGSGTGELVARILCDEKTDFDLQLFNPHRF